jgi:hypothetical protein
MSAVPSETFPALDLPFVRHAFLGRIPGLDVYVDRQEALQRLAGLHREAIRELGFGDGALALAGQVHGNEVALVEAAGGPPAPGADGLITNKPGVTLGIYVADCCPIYLVDPVARAIGLVHSGRKGTELGIAGKAIEAMQTHFKSNPADLVVQLGPCIRPPFYEVDFAADIVSQCRARGVTKVSDGGANTAADLTRYYSYRVEHGKTGRMLALLELC